MWKCLVPVMGQGSEGSVIKDVLGVVTGFRPVVLWNKESSFWRVSGVCAVALWVVGLICIFKKGKDQGLDHSSEAPVPSPATDDSDSEKVIFSELLPDLVGRRRTTSSGVDIFSVPAPSLDEGYDKDEFSQHLQRVFYMALDNFFDKSQATEFILPDFIPFLQGIAPQEQKSAISVFYGTLSVVLQTYRPEMWKQISHHRGEDITFTVIFYDGSAYASGVHRSQMEEVRNVFLQGVQEFQQVQDVLIGGKYISGVKVQRVWATFLYKQEIVEQSSSG